MNVSRLCPPRSSSNVPLMRRLVFAAILWGVGACTAGATDSERPSSCAPNGVTINSGVYGFVFNQCGELGGPCPGTPESGERVALFPPAPSDAFPPVGSAFLETDTGTDGLYQLASNDEADLCVGVNPQCTRVMAQQQALSRWDYVDEDGTGRRWISILCP